MLTCLKKDFSISPWFAYLIIAGINFGMYVLFSNMSFSFILSFFYLFFFVYIYDEKNNVNRYFVSLPIQRKTIIQSRYLYSLLTIIAILLFQWVVMLLFSSVAESNYMYGWKDIVSIFSIGCLLIAICIPIISFFHSLQIATIIILLIFGIGNYLLIDPLVEILDMKNGVIFNNNEIIFNNLDAGLALLVEKYVPFQPFLLLLIISGVILYVSMKVSIHFYKQKEF